MPIVSVIIPFYNRSAWLIEAVYSVLSQTYTDFEIIIINDGSSEVFNPFDVFDDERIVYVEQENSGPATARNVGINRAQGKYIAFLDADDLFLPSKLEIQVRCMEGNPDIALSHTGYTKITGNGEFIENVDSGQFNGVVYPKIITHCPIATPTVMVRRDVLSSLRFVEDARVGEDIMLWISIAMISKIIGIKEPLSKVRIHGSNAALDPEIQLDANLKIIEYAVKNDKNLNSVFRRMAMSRIYLYVGSLNFELNEKYKGICCISKSIVCNPIDYKLYFLLLHKMLPKTLRMILKRIKNKLKFE